MTPEQLAAWVNEASAPFHIDSWTAKVFATRFAALVRAAALEEASLDELTPEQRLEFFERLSDRYCMHCGRSQAPGQPCQCWNDE